jgi:dihydrodipicolinate synthase/N-acetylneuraminate lyase
MPLPISGGLIPPILSPLLPDDTVDQKSLHHLVEHIMTGGGTGIFVLGSTGEGALLSLDQRRTIVISAIEATHGRGPLLAGIEECSVRKVMEVMAALNLPGVDAFVVTLPFYGEFSDVGMQISFFKAIADEAPRPLVLYNIPAAVHAILEPETLFELSKHPNIIGVKDSYGDMARFQRLLRLCGQGDFAIFQGTQRVAGLSLLAGADGLVPGLANLAPSWFAEMIEAAGLHQVERVLDIQKRIVALWTLQSHSTHWLGCLKVAANLLGLCGTTVSAPLPKLSEEEVARVKSVLEQTGLI